MLTLNVNGSKGSYELNLPTRLDEITKGYIENVTKHIKLDANYSLIGLVYREKLSSIIFATTKNKKSADIAVIPVFVKAGDTSSSFIKSLKVRDKLIIAPSDIMIGYHVSTPDNLLTINNFIDIVTGDQSMYNKCLNIKDECYFIEFKLVPNCSIHGSYDAENAESIENPYVTKIAEAVKVELITPNKPNIIV